jgi:hypothetical protein
MSFGFIAVGLTVASGVAAKSSADKSAKAQKKIGEYNSAAQLANGRIGAAVTRFDAIGPSFQARMEAESARTNEQVYAFNADIARTQGEIESQEYILRAKEVLADAGRAKEDLAFDAFDASKDRRAANTQFQLDLDGIQRQERERLAMSKATYASTGISLDSGVVNAIEHQVVEDTERQVAYTMLARTIESKSIGKTVRSARKRAGDITRQAAGVSETFEQKSMLRKLAGDREALSAELEADNMAATGEYMSWYADFITESADLKAQVLETGAQISAESTFSTAMANASATKAAGTAALLGSFASAAGGLK